MSPDISSQAKSQLISEDPLPLSRNVVICGESGVGKSSIVNMLAGQDVFKVDGGAKGTTFEHKGCAIRFGDLNVNVWDTAGLSESDQGQVPPEKAFQQLFDLFCHLRGVNLLIFVMRFRITKTTVENYNLMRDVLCGERVPMVVAITNREFEDDNDKWWQENENNFLRNKMAFKAHAIGTAKRRFQSDQTYADLKDGLQDLIQKYASQTKLRFMPSELEGSDTSGDPIYRWFEHAVIKVFGRFTKIFRKPKEELLGLYCDVLKRNGMTDEQAAWSTERVREKLQ